MGFSFDVSIPVFTVFIQGLISFFSPCVLPLIPLYIGYLSGGAKTVDENGKVHYGRRKVIVNTVFFVAWTWGVCNRKFFQRKPGYVCKNWRDIDYYFWPVPVGGIWEIPGAWQRT